jgi:hypothetical protein
MRINSKGFAQIIVVILLLILIGAAAYYFGTQKGKLVLNTSSTPVPIESNQPISPSVTPDSTANWKTYINKTYGYSIKVPAYLSQEMMGLDDMWFFAKTDLSLLDAAHKAVSIGSSISIQINSRKDAIQLNYDGHCQGNLLSQDQENPIISQISLVDNAEQYIQSSGVASRLTHPQVKYWDSHVCFVKNGILYEIFYENDESINSDPTLYQILSTFKFTQ